MGTSTAQGGGSSGGMDIAGLITSGVDDLMQTNEFAINTTRAMKQDKFTNKLLKRKSDAESALLEVQAMTLENKNRRDKKIRNLMLGYR